MKGKAKGKNPNAEPRKKPTSSEVYRHLTRLKQQAFRGVPAPMPTHETVKEDPAHV